MKILIDATVIPLKKAGVGAYARNLIDHLTRESSPHEYLILAQNDDPEMDFGDRRHVTMLKVPARFFRKLPLRFLLEQVWLPLLLWKRRVDVVHSLHYALPLVSFGTRRVVTMHDMTFFNMPEVHERFKIVYFRAMIRASLHLADHLIFVSHSVLRDCLLRLGPPRGQASVVPHGKSDAFVPMQSATTLESVRQTYGIGEEFVLFLGTIEPRKNLTRLVEAFALIAPRHPSLQLVLAGNRGWMTEELFGRLDSLGLGSRVVLPGFVAEQDKPALLAACTLFVYPSLYEGFGLPVLEAMACGAPVITSNLSSLPEVAGDAALLIDPSDTEALSRAMEEVLSSPARQARMRHDGPVQAAKFTWARTATLTAEVYLKAAVRKGSPTPAQDEDFAQP